MRGRRKTTIVSAVDYGEPGMQLFVYGREEGNDTPAFPLSGATDSRSQRGGGEAENQVNPQQVIFAQQNPTLSTRRFHNDVIAVSNRQVLFCHQQAFARQSQLLGKPGCAGERFYGDSSSGNSGFRALMRCLPICFTANC
ncbi:N-succinylarginine dihydrolase [Escherichia coli]